MATNIAKQYDREVQYGKSSDSTTDSTPRRNTVGPTFRCLGGVGASDAFAEVNRSGNSGDDKKSDLQVPNVSSSDLASNENSTQEAFEHHEGHSSAATFFQPKTVDDPQKARKLNRLKKHNDGLYDDDRQSWEGERDKMMWVGTHGHRLSLPSYVIGEAKQLLTDLGDIRYLGHYNNLHIAVLASLIEAYRRHWHRLGYRLADNDCAQRWCERDDFQHLWQELGLREDDIRDVISLLNKKT